MLPAEGATHIAGIYGPRFFPRGGGDKGHAIMDDRRARQACPLMLFDAFLPALLTGAGVKRVDPPILLAEHQCDASRIAGHSHGAAHRAICLVKPVDAPALGIERLNHPTRATKENRAVQDGRCTECRDITADAKSPFQFQAWERRRN